MKPTKAVASVPPASSVVALKKPSICDAGGLVIITSSIRLVHFFDGAYGTFLFLLSFPFLSFPFLSLSSPPPPIPLHALAPPPLG